MIRTNVKNVVGDRNARSLGNLGFEKFMMLARNSFKVKKYSRTADNCRLAADAALSRNKPRQAAQAYQLWIKSLFEQGKYMDVKKVCCDARNKFGNKLDLLYFEFKAAMSSRHFRIAAKLAQEFIEMHKNSRTDPSAPFNTSIDKLDDVKSALKEIKDDAI